MTAPLQIGILLFPKVTQLDFTGPLQVFSSVPGAKVHLIWKRIEPVASDSVMILTPTTTFADCPQLDVICVPGGMGTDDMVNDEEMLAFLRKQADGARFITSVCTGSLVLGAAGLLKGYRAATHWSAIDYLPAFGAIRSMIFASTSGGAVSGDPDWNGGEGLYSRRSWIASAVVRSTSIDTRVSAKSIPAVTPPPVTRLRSVQTRVLVGVAPKADRYSIALQCVAAR